MNAACFVGYDNEGYDRHGYSQHGYDRRGYDRHGKYSHEHRRDYDNEDRDYGYDHHDHHEHYPKDNGHK